ETPACRALFESLRERFDLIIVDSPPVLPVADPLLLAREADGVVVVTRASATTRTGIQRALNLLAQTDANLLGVVLNAADARTSSSAYGQNDYTYYREPTRHEPTRREPTGREPARGESARRARMMDESTRQGLDGEGREGNRPDP